MPKIDRLTLDTYKLCRNWWIKYIQDNIENTYRMNNGIESGQFTNILKKAS